MELEVIVPVISALVSYIFGLLAKRFNWYDESKYIPLQNLVIGFVAAFLYCLFKGEYSQWPVAAVTICSGLFAGGVYDLTKVGKEAK